MFEKCVAWAKCKAATERIVAGPAGKEAEKELERVAVEKEADEVTMGDGKKEQSEEEEVEIELCKEVEEDER